ncbi:Uncharacterised protein [Mycobacteroides abscessus subsp. abscessus]|nr:Uncharacterised protein [Mycobacteroides abscessus subsp. abscessus]
MLVAVAASSPAMTIAPTRPISTRLRKANLRAFSLAMTSGSNRRRRDEL